MIKNIIFDVGNVLVDFDPEFLLDTLNIDDSVRSVLYSNIFQSPLWNEYDRSTETVLEIKEHFYKDLPEYRMYIDKIFDSINCMHKIRTFVMPWLEELKNEGFRLYILSNLAQHTFNKCQDDFHFLNLMDGAVFSFQCHYIKPEDEIYQYLLETYRLVPEECVFIDDRSANINKAREFGIRGILFKNFDDTCAQLKRYLMRKDDCIV